MDCIFSLLRIVLSYVYFCDYFSIFKEITVFLSWLGSNLFIWLFYHYYFSDDNDHRGCGAVGTYIYIFFFILGVPPLLPKILAVWDYFAWEKYRDAWRKHRKVTKVVVKSNGVVLLVANWKYVRFLIQLWERCIEEWIHWHF